MCLACFCKACAERGQILRVFNRAHAGHCYYFLEDVYPRMTGRRPLRTPGLIKALFPGDEAPGGIRIARTPPPPAPHAFPAPGVVPAPGQDPR